MDVGIKLKLKVRDIELEYRGPSRLVDESLATLVERLIACTRPPDALEVPAREPAPSASVAREEVIDPPPA